MVLKKIHKTKVCILTATSQINTRYEIDKEEGGMETTIRGEIGEEGRKEDKETKRMQEVDKRERERHLTRKKYPR